MNYFLKELILNKSNYSTSKIINYDIQKHLVLCKLIDERIIPGVGQLHINSPGPFL